VVLRGRHLRLVLVFAFAGWCLGSASLAAQSPAVTPTLDDLLSGTTLNDVWLHINARDWADLQANYRENTYYPADFEWQGVRVRNAGVRTRGRISRNDRKPSLRVDFNRYVTGQQFLGVKAIVLNSLWMDPSMLRDRLSMLLFRRMGIPAPREGHVRLFIGANREYAGVYSVVEEVNPAFLQANFNQNDGYLYEYHIQGAYGFEDPGPDLDWYRPRFDAQTHENGSTVELYAPVQSLVETVNAASPSDLRGALADVLDIDTFITQIAIQNFVAQQDGLVGQFGMNNFYLYRFEAQSLSQIIPWDQDGSFRMIDMPPWQNMDTNVLAAKIWADPTYRDLYLRKLVEVATLAGPWLEDEVVREYAQLREAVSVDPLAPYPFEQFESEVAFIQQFARDRAAIIRSYVEQVSPSVLGDGFAGGRKARR